MPTLSARPGVTAGNRWGRSGPGCGRVGRKGHNPAPAGGRPRRRAGARPQVPRPPDARGRRKRPEIPRPKDESGPGGASLGTAAAKAGSRRWGWTDSEPHRDERPQGQVSRRARGRPVGPTATRDSHKVGIVGSGLVGVTAAYSQVIRGVGREIVLVDGRGPGVAEADDIRHAVRRPTAGGPGRRVRRPGRVPGGGAVCRVGQTFPLPLSEAEQAQLRASAGVIRGALDELDRSP